MRVRSLRVNLLKFEIFSVLSVYSLRKFRQCSTFDFSTFRNSEEFRLMNPLIDKLLKVLLLLFMFDTCSILRVFRRLDLFLSSMLNLDVD